eukprot:scaffold8280_cov258-Pinguiococcus_pyrenoidosus.AAC.2
MHYVRCFHISRYFATGAGGATQKTGRTLQSRLSFLNAVQDRRSRPDALLPSAAQRVGVYRQRSEGRPSPRTFKLNGIDTVLLALALPCFLACLRHSSMSSDSCTQGRVAFACRPLTATLQKRTPGLLAARGGVVLDAGRS